MSLFSIFHVRKCHFSMKFILESVTFHDETWTRHHTLSFFSEFYVRKCHFSFHKIVYLLKYKIAILGCVIVFCHF